MPQDFKARFFLYLLKEWSHFICSIQPTDTTPDMITFTEQLSRDKDITIRITTFIQNWNILAKTFPDSILSQTTKIEALIQIWADYHKLDVRLEELSL